MQPSVCCRVCAYILIIEFVGFVLFNLRLYNDSLNYSQNHETLFEDQEGCHIPHINPWDPSILKLVKRPRKLICKSERPVFVSLENDGCLRLNQKTLLRSNYTEFSCRFRCFDRKPGNDKRLIYESWEQMDLDENCTQVFCEFIHVQCHIENGSSVYSDVFSQIIPNETRLAELSTNQRPPLPHHVIILVFDSVSRLNFERMAPKTLDVLRRLYGSVVFEGFTKVADNSFPNGFVFLTGQDHRKVLKGYNISRIHFDWLNLVWKNYSSVGYLTLLVEDAANLNLFTYLKKGFKERPTDHRQRPFWQACKFFKQCQKDMDPCLKNMKKNTILLDYLKQFLMRYDAKIPKFVLFWNTGLVHDYVNRLSLVDDEMSKFLHEHFELLRESFLIVMGDHGHRFGKLRRTFVGQIEDNMPFFSLALPQSLKRSEPLLRENMKQNSQYLASFYDFYVTLIDILNSQQNGWTNLSSQKNWSNEFGQSLLRPLTDRNCAQAGIPPDFCICSGEIELNSSSGPIQTVARALIVYLNTAVLKNNPKCAQLKLEKVLTAREFVVHLQNDARTASEVRRKIRISVQATPSAAIFESILQFDGSVYSVVGDVARINKYGNQSSCVNDPVIQKYCYCKV